MKNPVKIYEAKDTESRAQSGRGKRSFSPKDEPRRSLSYPAIRKGEHSGNLGRYFLSDPVGFYRGHLHSLC